MTSTLLHGTHTTSASPSNSASSLSTRLTRHSKRLIGRILTDNCVSSVSAMVIWVGFTGQSYWRSHQEARPVLIGGLLGLPLGIEDHRLAHRSNKGCH